MHLHLMSPHMSKLRSQVRRKCQSAFTLIELMVVVGVIALVTAAIAPMVFSTMASTRITSAGETLASQIALGHQLAVSGNQEVEVRFYQYEDINSPGSGTGYRAVAMVRASTVFGTTGSGALGQLLTEPFYMPSGIVIGENAKLSPPLSKLSPESDKEGIIKKARSATYRAFHFYPNGSTDLNQHSLVANQCYFTLGEERLISKGDIPKNFYAVQVDPYTGRTATYRP
ncbi:MAG: Verru Chthon cassette protein [Verrucomicrobiaceae bacterium]|nr:Verru Chthon cassette protein [Verrucomicrobiaceae bacterium]